MKKLHLFWTEYCPCIIIIWSCIAQRKSRFELLSFIIMGSRSCCFCRWERWPQFLGPLGCRNLRSRAGFTDRRPPSPTDAADKAASVYPRKKAEISGYVWAVGGSTPGRATRSFKERPRQRKSIRKSYFIDRSIGRARVLARRDACARLHGETECRKIGREEGVSAQAQAVASVCAELREGKLKVKYRSLQSWSMPILTLLSIPYIDQPTSNQTHKSLSDVRSQVNHLLVISYLVLVRGVWSLPSPPIKPIRRSGSVSVALQCSFSHRFLISRFSPSASRERAPCWLWFCSCFLQLPASQLLSKVSGCDWVGLMGCLRQREAQGLLLCDSAKSENEWKVTSLMSTHVISSATFLLLRIWFLPGQLLNQTVFELAESTKCCWWHRELTRQSVSTEKLQNTP